MQGVAADTCMQRAHTSVWLRVFVIRTVGGIPVGDASISTNTARVSGDDDEGPLLGSAIWVRGGEAGSPMSLVTTPEPASALVSSEASAT